MLWWGLGIVGVIIWICIAFWPARVAGRKGHSFFGIFRSEPLLLPAFADHGLRRTGPHPARCGIAAPAPPNDEAGGAGVSRHSRRGTCRRPKAAFFALGVSRVSAVLDFDCQDGT